MNEIRVAMVGHAFMGAAHSHAWRTAPHVFELPFRPVMAVICGRDADAVRKAADRYGWAATETDWRALVGRPDVDVVDICVPGDLHAPIAIAALEAGKHVLCEKPLANTVPEAAAMANAAASARTAAMAGFNYRRVPALAKARSLVAAGRIGTVRQLRASYLQDWLTDPAFPLTWRLRQERAGSGALGDLGSHLVDLAQYLTGEAVTGVSAITETFTRERDGGAVTVDDAVLFSARLSGGAIGSFEASRVAAGRKNQLRIELNGSAGSLAFDLERLNELQVCDDTAGFRRVLVTEPDDPYLSAWWPPGHALGWDVTFVHQVRDLMDAIASGTRPEPSFHDALQVQRVLDAVARSAAGGSAWTAV